MNEGGASDGRGGVIGCGTGGRGSIKRYVLLGSFLGGLVGTTVALLVFSKTSEERREIVREMQNDLFTPVKVKFAEVVEHLGNTLMEAVEEAGQKAREG